MVGKRLNPTDNWMPPRVYRGKSSYEWRPKGGGCLPLCKRPKDGIENESVKRLVYRAWDKAKANASLNDTVSLLIDQYFASPQFARLAVVTQDDYRIYDKKIRLVFGKMSPRKVTPGLIRQFMDKVGEKHPVSANRHHSFLSTLFGWAYERDFVERNPATGVKKFPETPRDRYIQDWEFDLVYEVARSSSYPYIAAMMEIAYLCRARSIELRRLNGRHLMTSGIFIERAKGSENEITRWTPRLRAAVAFAKSLHPDAPVAMDRPLFHNRRGQRLLKSSYSTAWARVMTAALRDGLEIDGETIKLTERFTFHDIKAKGVTDHKEKYGGHRSKKMQAVYDRKPAIRDATR